MLTTLALVATLNSLSEDDFDGLNNMAQIPFALPWFLLPLPAIFDLSHEQDAWATAILGWLNAAVIVLLIHRWVQRKQMRTMGF